MSSIEALVLRLSELRGAVDVGNERTAGQLALLVEKSAHAEQNALQFRQWVEKELARLERAGEAEELARAKADEATGAELRTLERKSAIWSGVGLTLSAIGGTMLGHFWPH